MVTNGSEEVQQVGHLPHQLGFDPEHRHMVFQAMLRLIHEFKGKK